jgi:transcriptional regulator with XRE-family HTH domain
MEYDILQIVGRRVRDLRKQKGLSQEQLGELAGVHFTYIGKVERAEKNVSLLNLEKIALALKVTIFDLFIYGSNLRVEQNDKDVLLNQIIQQLNSLNKSDLRKFQRILNEFFQ